MVCYKKKKKIQSVFFIILSLFGMDREIAHYNKIKDGIDQSLYIFLFMYKNLTLLGKSKLLL